MKDVSIEDLRKSYADCTKGGLPEHDDVFHEVDENGVVTMTCEKDGKVVFLAQMSLSQFEKMRGGPA